MFGEQSWPLLKALGIAFAVLIVGGAVLGWVL